MNETNMVQHCELDMQNHVQIHFNDIEVGLICNKLNKMG